MFEIGDILQYDSADMSFKCMVIGFRYILNQTTLLSEDGNSIWNEELYNPDIFYSKIGHVNLSLLFGG